MKKILVLNGPNLNMLGKRDPAIYGADTLPMIEALMQEYAGQHDITLAFFQSNHEGSLIDKIHECGASCDGIILNAGAYSHTSYAIADALSCVPAPCIEVHLSNVYAREEFRRKSVLAPVCVGCICGVGKDSYLLAIDALRRRS